MVSLIFMYNLKPGITPEEYEKWFSEVHIPDIKRIPGLRKVFANKVIGSLSGEPAEYYRAGELHFDDMEDIQKAFAWIEENLNTDESRSVATRIDFGPMLICEGEEIEL